VGETLDRLPSDTKATPILEKCGLGRMRMESHACFLLLFAGEKSWSFRDTERGSRAEHRLDIQHNRQPDD